MCYPEVPKITPFLEKGALFAEYYKGQLLPTECWFLLDYSLHAQFLLYFTSVLLLIMWSQSASIAWTVTSTAAFYHCWSYTEHSDIWIRYVYIFDINVVCPYEICKFMWFLIWYYVLHMFNSANSTLGYENWYCFISIKFDFQKKRIIGRSFVADVTKFLWLY